MKLYQKPPSQETLIPSGFARVLRVPKNTAYRLDGGNVIDVQIVDSNGEEVYHN